MENLLGVNRIRKTQTRPPEKQIEQINTDLKISENQPDRLNLRSIDQCGKVVAISISKKKEFPKLTFRRQS
ncbi:hypothetical protein [Melioribacter roseus]|uniref:hypothetical protein n=1 Tax=Melioribacter roseus TaxID=1134405 RepID=UPI0006880E01|nr:hypothetical protein [Melioribacter roseus]